MRKITTLLILISVMALTACNGRRSKTRLTLEEMIGSRIDLPEEVLCVFERECRDMEETLRRKPKLLVFVDSTACNECQISHFFRFEEIMKEVDVWVLMK